MHYIRNVIQDSKRMRKDLSVFHDTFKDIGLVNMKKMSKYSEGY